MNIEAGPLRERIITPMPKSLVAAIAEYRWQHKLASRSGAVRELLTLGLEAARQQQRGSGVATGATEQVS